MRRGRRRTEKETASSVFAAAPPATPTSLYYSPHRSSIPVTPPASSESESTASLLPWYRHSPESLPALVRDYRTGAIAKRCWYYLKEAMQHGAIKLRIGAWYYSIWYYGIGAWYYGKGFGTTA
eukprot:967875-Rhodomonas_salina.1